MKKNYAKSLLTYCFAMASMNAMAQANVMFNEVMQSNVDYLMVENDYPDSWAELYNPTDNAISLAGWYLGTDSDVSKAYRLTGRISIPAGGHFLICCDKEGKGVHTDFRINSDKGSLYLFDSHGEVVDALTLKAQPAANIAYGRKTDGAEEWQYELAPSAGKPNYGPGAAEVLPEPLFSQQGGLYDEPLTLEITKPEGCPPEALIFYTTNGSEPVPGQPGAKGGMKHTVEISKSTVVRAKIVHPQYKALSPRSTTRSYIYHPRKVTMPVVSIASDNGCFYDAATGILSSTVNNGTPNYMQKWRRPINVEYYDAQNKEVFNQLGETAVSGVSTREQPQKSLKIYTNKRFGKKNFKGAFWSDKPDVKKVKSFVIRSGGNNSGGARVNDALVQRLFGTHVEDLDWQAYQPVIVYLNGNYFGVAGMRERSDENYVEANYDGLEDIEMADEALYQKPVAGSLFKAFFDAYRSSTTDYAAMTEQMDEDNYMNSLIAELYAMNSDFPTNNVSLWRPLEEGGKWCWILKDLDRFGMQMALYPLEFDMFSYLLSPDELMFGGINNFDLYKKMDSFAPFRDRMVETFAVYLGDFLRPEYVISELNAMHADIEDEVKATFSTYNMSYSAFSEATKWLKRTISERPGYLYRQMNSRYGLGGLVAMKVIGDKAEDSDSRNDGLTDSRSSADLRINGISLKEGDFDGQYFLGHNLHLTAGEGYGWKMVVETPGSEPVEYTNEDSEWNLLLKDYATTASTVTLSACSFSDGIREVRSHAPRSRKVLEGNRLVIYRNGFRYNALGATGVFTALTECQGGPTKGREYPLPTEVTPGRRTKRTKSPLNK